MPLRGRAAALVALAALEPGISRERAALMLWPDAPNPRQNLRQQLLRFKQALGQALVEGEERLHLAADVTLAESPAPQAQLLAAEGVADDAFGQWLAQRRGAEQQQRRGPLLKALSDAETRGDLDAALAQAQALLALEPLEEAHHAALMRLHYLRGEAAAGLRAYQVLCDLLTAQYGTQPAPKTRELADALRRGQALAGKPGTAAPQAAGPWPVVPAPSGLPITLKRPPLLAGREAEWAAVHAAWREGQAVLLEGEAGLGKSRLMAELLGTAAPMPQTLQAAGRPGDSGVPYATLTRLLGPLDPPAATHSPAEVEALLRQHGVQAVALDDLHFADEATLEMVAGLIAAAPQTPRRWLLASRPAESDAVHRLLSAPLIEQQRLFRVSLAPLSEAAAGALLQALAIPALAAGEWAPRLVRHSGGNPLFLLETLKQGLVDGSLARGELPRPASVGALIEHRLQRLSEPALVLARVAAIAGIDFSIELAEVAIGQPAVQLATPWQELQEAQILRDEGFAHDLVADAVLRGVPPVVARRVHAQCAAWLAAHGGQAARVARHWQRGGHPREAALAFGQAAAQALAASRRHEEADLLAQAAAEWQRAGNSVAHFDALASRVSALIAAHLGPGALAEAQALEAHAANDLQRARALRVHADLLGQAGQAEASAQRARTGLALAEQIQAREEQLRLATQLAGSLCNLGRPDEAYSLLLPLQGWAPASEEAELRMLWFGYWGATLSHIGRLREAVAAYDDAVLAAESMGRPDALGSVVLNQGVVLRTLGRLPRAIDCSRRGVDLMSHEPDQTTNRTMARLMHARDQAECGEYGPALQAFEALRPEFEAMGTNFWTCALLTAQASLWLHLGQQARALQALAGSEAGTPPWMRAGRLMLRAETAAAFDQAAPEDSADQATALVATDPHRGSGIAVRALRLAAPESVLAQADDWADTVTRQERFGLLLALRVHEARAALALGRFGHAVQAARQALALQAEGYRPEAMYPAELHWVAGQALAASGATEEARAIWQAGGDWVRSQALPHVPPPFIESFLHRNAINRALLAALAQA